MFDTRVGIHVHGDFGVATGADPGGQPWLAVNDGALPCPGSEVCLFFRDLSGLERLHRLVGEAVAFHRRRAVEALPETREAGPVV